MYEVVYLDQFEKDFKKIDKPVRKKIISKIENELAKDPYALGEPLKGQFKGMWRFRFGNYRVIYRIAEKEILILIARVGHRKNIYLN